MTDSDKARFGEEVMGPMYLVFEKKPSVAMTRVYFEALRPYLFEEVRAAMHKALRRASAFMPRPGELIVFITGGEEEQAMIAWGRAHNAALKGYGAYRPLDFDDHLIHAAVQAMGGWGTIYQLGHRDSELVDAASLRKQFITLYIAFLHRGVPPTVPPALHCEQDRAGSMPPMKLNEIGEPEATVKALPVGEPAPAPVYVPPPEGWKAMVAELAARRTVPSSVREAKPVERTFTAEEIEQQERDKQAKVQDLRDKGLLPPKES